MGIGHARELLKLHGTKQNRLHESRIQARIHHWGWVGMHPPPPAVPEKNCSLFAGH